MKTLKEDYKFAMICLKYIPVIMFLLMWGHTVFALLGIQLGIADTVVGCSLFPSVLIFSLSQVFHFCWLHKTLTAYSFIVDILINIDKYFGFGTVTPLLQTIVAIIGLIIFILLTFKLNVCKNKCS